MKLLFVYHADSDPRAKLVDGLHKLLSPATYSCGLCRLTHGSFGPRKQWKDFVQQTKVDMEFVYKDQFSERYPKVAEAYGQLPLVLEEDQNGLNLVLTAEAIGKLKDVNALIDALNRHLGIH